MTSKFDKFRGIIWGCALGDAIGLQFEKSTTTHAKNLADKGVVFPSGGSAKGDWTDDTDHMVLLLDSAYFDTDGIMRIDNKLFASKLVLWRYNGFAELGDTCGSGLGSLTAKLTAHPRFILQPQTVAIEVYKNLGGDLNVGKLSAPAPNGALMRMAPLALSNDYMSEITDNCLATHFDTRCLVSCLLQADIIRCLLINGTISVDDIEKFSKNNITLLDKEFIEEYELYFNIGYKSDLVNTNLFTELKVGEYSECNKNGYTLVAMAIMVWAVRKAIAGCHYEEIIIEIISAGGDADTNAAIAGAVLGAFFGYKKLPKLWINNTPNKDWLDKKIMDFFHRK